MQRMFWTVLMTGLTCATLCAAADERTGRPIPAGKEAATHAQFAQAHLKFSLVDVELYRKLTQDPLAVRDAAAEFIGAVYARNLLGTATPTWEDLDQMAGRLSARGAKDPVVLSQSALVLGNQGRFQQASIRLTEAMAAFKQSEYPVRLKYRAMDRLLWAMSRCGRTKGVLAMMPEYRELAVQWLQIASSRPEDQRFLVYAVNNIFLIRAKGLIKDQEALCEGCRDKAGIDRWTQEILLGRYYTALAWYHRGGGFANTVTPEGAAKFEESLRLAARHYTAAWELHRDWPESAAEMIGVSMGLADAKLTPRDWFDRAVAGQMDFPPAYRSMLWALRPRWGGSHEAMYRFGLECLATRRFDTDVPFQLIQALLDIQSELPASDVIWRRPEVYQNVRSACEGMEQEPSRADDQRSTNPHAYTMSLQAAAAMHAQQYGDVRRLLEELGDRVQPAVFDKLRRRLDDDRPLAFALTGKGGKEVGKALRLLDAGDDLPNRLKAYDLLSSANKLDNDPRARVFYERKLAMAQWERGFAAGDWVDLTFQPEKGLWQTRRGKWTVVDPHHVVGKSNGPEDGMIYTCRAQFLPPLEIELDVESLNPPRRALRPGVSVGQWQTAVPTGPGDLPTGMLFWGDAPGNRSGVARIGESSWSQEQLLSKPCHFRLRVWKDYFEFYVDRRLFPVHDSRGFIAESPVCLGNAYWLREAGEARFSNLRVRKLTMDVPPPESEDRARVQYYTAALVAQPDDAYAFYFRAVAHYRLGNPQQAKIDLREALARCPEVADAAISRAEELAQHARRLFTVACDFRADGARSAGQRPGKAGIGLVPGHLRRERMPQWVNGCDTCPAGL